MRERLGSAEFLGRHRRRAQDFSRQRHLSFARVLLMVLQKGARSLAGRLADFFAQLARGGGAAPALAGDEPGVTPGAWTQARAKLAHTAFVELSERAVLEVFYAPDNQAQVRRWQGRRLCAIDGSIIQLPASAALGEHFGWVQPSNQKGACGARQVQALASVYFDVLNRLGLEARLEPGRASERQLAALHRGAWRAGDVVLTDRGYCGLEWFAQVRAAAGVDFVCRVPRRCWVASNVLFEEDRAGADQCVQLLPHAAQRNAGMPPAGLRVRLVSLRLPGGQLEVLATSLLDAARYPLAALGEAYAQRWGIETYYGLLKGRLGLENFSGHTLEAVRQDFFGSVFLSNVESLLSAPAQAHLSARDAQRQHPAARQPRPELPRPQEPGHGVVPQRRACGGPAGPADPTDARGPPRAPPKPRGPASAPFAQPLPGPPALPQEAIVLTRSSLN